MSLTQESLLSFLLEHGGKVRNSELINYFRSGIHGSDPAEKQHNRELFKRLVNSVAVVKQIDEVKFVVLKKRFQDFVKEAADESFSSRNTSFSPESARVIISDIENNNVCYPSHINGNYCSDAKPVSVESTLKRRVPLRNASSVDTTTTVKVLNIPGDQASRAGKSGAVFAVIAVKSPPREGLRSQVPISKTSGQQITLGTKVSAQSEQSLTSNFSFCKKNALKESQDTQSLGFPQVRPQSKSTRQPDDAKYCESVPLEPLAHEWLVKCAAGLWGQIYALLLRDARLAQKKDFMSGFTALHWAAKDSNCEMIHKLMDVCRKRGIYVDVNSKAHGGYTPLHIAAIHRHTEVMVLLVQNYGASVNERDNDGKKAIHYLGTGVLAEVRALLGGVLQREKMEEEEYREQAKSFNTISKLFQPHMGKKHKTSTKVAHDW